MASYIDKIFSDVDTLRSHLNLLEPSTIVFTNGCFDLLHEGHIYYLELAKEQGNFLVVGINSDRSVKALKGHSRPIKNLKNRIAVLAGLESVDAIISFDEDTPYELIKSLEPDILIKGGDYDLIDIVGADIVKSKGGKVTTIPFMKGESSSNFLQKK